MVCWDEALYSIASILIDKGQYHQASRDSQSVFLLLLEETRRILGHEHKKLLGHFEPTCSYCTQCLWSGWQMKKPLLIEDSQITGSVRFPLPFRNCFGILPVDDFRELFCQGKIVYTAVYLVRVSDKISFCAISCYSALIWNLTNQYETIQINSEVNMFFWNLKYEYTENAKRYEWTDKILLVF